MVNTLSKAVLHNKIVFLDLESTYHRWKLIAPYFTLSSLMKKHCTADSYVDLIAVLEDTLGQGNLY